MDGTMFLTLITPSRSDRKPFCIFIASTTQSSWPVTTCVFLSLLSLHSDSFVQSKRDNVCKSKSHLISFLYKYVCDWARHRGHKHATTVETNKRLVTSKFFGGGGVSAQTSATTNMLNLVSMCSNRGICFINSSCRRVLIKTSNWWPKNTSRLFKMDHQITNNSKL